MFKYQFTVGWLTILSGLIAIGCLWVGAIAVDFNFAVFSNPSLALAYSDHLKEAHWFMMLDMFGYYLLLIPIIIFFHQQYKQHSPWTSLFTFSGLAYVLVGSIGAVILADAWPELMKAFLISSSSGKETISLIFVTLTNSVTKGLWNILEVLFAAIWWIGIGRIIYKDNKTMGILSIATGISTGLDGIANISGLYSLAEIFLNAYLVLGILWPLTLGSWFLKKQNTPANRQSFIFQYDKCPVI